MPTRFAGSALVLMVVAASGCYRWTELALPSPSIAGGRGEDVRVTLTDVESAPHVARASGTIRWWATRRSSGAAWLLAWQSPALVRTVSRREISAGRTALLVAALPVAVGGVGLLSLVLGWGYSR